MAQLGNFVLALAWVLALLGTFSGLLAGWKNSFRLTAFSRGSAIATFAVVALAFATLISAFLNDDYTVQYVWQYSNMAMDWYYKISAIWGGMDGSMLLWCLLLSTSVAVASYNSKRYPANLTPWTLAILQSSTLFFLTVVFFITNPFRIIQSAVIPPDGNGLNPLLQNPLMVIHPPMLYLGFTSFAVPYSFCMGALLSGSLSNEWLRLTRTWTLVGWGFLTAGIILGGHWAYVELGWGGFWAWDPVENASFLPWLSATAYIHSVMVQDRKDMLKGWNVWLIVLTYGLTVFGTFLTRSGIVQSVHAFANTDVGGVFLTYLGIIFTLAAVLAFWRRTELSSPRRLESIFSREAIFLVNNLLLLSIAFATIWGVMFPILSEAITGTKQTVSIPFFNAVNVPLFLVLIFLMGVGPLIAWRKASFSSIRRTFFWPFLGGCLMSAVLLFVGIQGFYPIVSYGLCWFVTLTILFEVHRGVRALRPQAGSTLNATKELFSRHRSRYGGHLVHLGVVVCTVGITASMAHKIEREFSLSVGEQYTVGRFFLKLNSFDGENNGNYEALHANVTLGLIGTGEVLKTLLPESRYYLRNKEQTTEVALRVGLREDVYLSLAGVDETGNRATFKLFINPLQVWLWVGGVIILLGTMVVILPNARSSKQSF